LKQFHFLNVSQIVPSTHVVNFSHFFTCGKDMYVCRALFREQIYQRCFFFDAISHHKCPNITSQMSHKFAPKDAGIIRFNLWDTCEVIFKGVKLKYNIKNLPQICPGKSVSFFLGKTPICVGTCHDTHLSRGWLENQRFCSGIFFFENA